MVFYCNECSGTGEGVKMDSADAIKVVDNSLVGLDAVDMFDSQNIPFLKNSGDDGNPIRRAVFVF